MFSPASLDVLFFWVFALITVAGALGTVTFRNPVHCAAGLTASLMGVAGIFLLQGAEFLSVAQVIIYVGGIMVLFLFVIMLVNVKQAETEQRFSSNGILALAVSLGAGGLILYLFTSRPLVMAATIEKNPALPGNTEQIGAALFTTYLLPFEIASVLLLAALVGCVVLARKTTS
jgi:NADH-quinone oxidoreductase subunit J